MKDLFVLAADADTGAFMRSILQRHHAIGIRPVSFDIERHPQRDAGMVQSGAELARMKKGKYHKALLMLDYYGSGRDRKQSPDELADDIQEKLNSFTWCNNSAVAVLVPELEQWLWHCQNAVATHCNVTPVQLDQWIAEFGQKLGRSVDELRKQQPKKLFEHVMRDRLKRTISPRDFEEIGKCASIHGLQSCDTFRSIVETLRVWFPHTAPACNP